MLVRRLVGFRLRTLLILVAAFSVWLGLHVRSSRMQEGAVQAIQDYGGWVRYDFQFPSGKFSQKGFDPNAVSGVPKWLLDPIGIDLFHNVVQVNLNYSNDSGKRLENHNPSDEALQHLPTLQNLRVLLLCGTQASDKTMRHLNKLKRLEYLYMWDAANVSDEGTAHLQPLKHLKYIHLSNSQITDESLRTFGELHSLEGLSLQFNRFSDQGLSHLSRLRNLNRLSVCGRQGRPNEITDVGLQALHCLRNLKSLRVQHTRVSVPGVYKLMEILPGCRIAWGGSKPLGGRQHRRFLRLGAATTVPPVGRGRKSGSKSIHSGIEHEE